MNRNKEEVNFNIIIFLAKTFSIILSTIYVAKILLTEVLRVTSLATSTLRSTLKISLSKHLKSGDHIFRRNPFLC